MMQVMTMCSNPNDQKGLHSAAPISVDLIQYTLNMYECFNYPIKGEFFEN